jgi:uncharacterized protein (DUF1015 family)
MPMVHPFHAIQFQLGAGDLSSKVAPPYDVLDAAGKARLLAKDAHNIVAIDLPHTPAKELGPASAYDEAASMYRSWLSHGILRRSPEPAIFAYRQTFRSGPTTTQRCGMACTLDVVPFGPRQGGGGGILPHEETFSGPKEDRMALMRATRAQLSPIFGLHADERGTATRLTRAIMDRSAPDCTATTGDGVLHELWTVRDGATIKAYQDALAGEDVFIADGHHRYTTGLTYLRQLEAQGPVPTDHPSRQSMFVLVSMSDPGLVIWPTHRVLGGMQGYTLDAFVQAAAGALHCTPVAGSLQELEKALLDVPMGQHAVGLYDFASRRCILAKATHADPLAAQFPDKPKAWRALDVAFIQYAIVEAIAQPKLNAGNAVKWAFPHTIQEVLDIGSGAETGAGGGRGFAQLALIVRSTPLGAVRDVSRANQLMPQKSTFFYPKLATGLFVHGFA